MRILMETASEIEDLKLLFDEKTHYMCRSILSQLRIWHKTLMVLVLFVGH